MKHNCEKNMKYYYNVIGEISEGFNPTMGENSEAVSSPAESPNRGRGAGGRGEGGALPLLLNDSDDSL